MYMARLTELVLFSLENRRLKRGFINVYKKPDGGNKEDGDRLFSVAPSERMAGNRDKLKYRKLHLNIEK